MRSRQHCTAGQDNGLAVLLDPLDIVMISDPERAGLTGLAGFGCHTVEYIAAGDCWAVRCPQPSR